MSQADRNDTPRQLLSLSKPSRHQRAQLLRIYRWMQSVAATPSYEDADGTRTLAPAAATLVRFMDEAAASLKEASSPEREPAVVIPRAELEELVKAAQSFCGTRSPWGETEGNEGAFRRAEKAIQGGYDALKR